jgi:NADPH:quinone reductase-like Zn-dependent oxidoreductase
MKAFVQERYGSPDVLQLKEIDKPAFDGNQVLMRVHAASLNALDWHYMRGWPYIARVAFGRSRPKDRIRGVDVAGRIEAVGNTVTQFRPGDEVFGVCTGAFAEYVSGEEHNFVLKPAGITFEQAAAVRLAAITALQALRDAGKVQTGQKVLINGAGGGVGSFAVQIAKSFGADVTAATRTKHLDMVRSIGADHVIDYSREDFTAGGRRYDLMLEIGNRSLSDCRRALTPKGTLVIVGGSDGRWVDGIGRIAAARLQSAFVSQSMPPFVAHTNHGDLVLLKELTEARKVVPVIDSVFPFDKVPDAMRRLEEGHACGKIVISMDGSV